MTIETDLLGQVAPKTVKGSAIKRLADTLGGQAFAVLAGTTANTDIAVAGIKLDDKILFVLEHDPNAGGAGVSGLNDRTSEASVTSAGNIQLDTTDTSGNQLVLVYLPAPA